MNLRPAPESIVLAIQRRMEKSPGGAQLAEDSVKLCALPGLPFDVTTFICVQNGKDGPPPRRFFVAEFCKPDQPHIYASEPLPVDAKTKEIVAVMLKVIAGIAKTIATDPRFKRNIIPVTLRDLRINGDSVRTLPLREAQKGGRRP